MKRCYRCERDPLATEEKIYFDTVNRVVCLKCREELAESERFARIEHLNQAAEAQALKEKKVTTASLMEAQLKTLEAILAAIQSLPAKSGSKIQATPSTKFKQ